MFIRIISNDIIIVGDDLIHSMKRLTLIRTYNSNEKWRRQQQQNVSKLREWITNGQKSKGEIGTTKKGTHKFTPKKTMNEDNSEKRIYDETSSATKRAITVCLFSNFLISEKFV